MIMYHCDGCKGQEQSLFAELPQGWKTIPMRQGDYHFCGKCSQKPLKALLDKIPAKEEAKA